MAQDDTYTPCSTGDSVDETRSIIDRDVARLENTIRGLEDSIRDLKSRRNELSPISRLPAEILCIIFSLSILWSPDGPESWTNFSQVSHRWRSLALSAPELWTNIPLDYPRWAQEMLIRSKMAKLTIRSDISFVKPKTIETIRSCLYEMNRVEAIDITCEVPGLTLEEIFRDLPTSAPQLRTLQIGCTPYFSGFTFSIHEDFLSDTDRLQCVELLNCKIGWESRVLTGLTRLTIKVRDSYKVNSSINQFLHALQRMPALTELRLKHSIPDSDDSEDPSSYPVVDLPCLRILDISTGVGALTAVLRHITFPHSATLNLVCNETESTQIDFSNFFSILATKFLSSLVFRSLGLRAFELFDNTSANGLEFYLSTTATTPDCSPFSEISQSQLQLFFVWPPSPQHRHAEALTSLFDVMSLPFLTELQISTHDYIDSQTCVKTIGKLPLLERVCVQSIATNWFFEALVYKTEAAEKSKTAYHNVSFPKLRYISLFNTLFSISNGTSVDMLLDCLMERCERNAEVQVLRVARSFYITPNEVERLKEIVVDVIWDGP